MCYAHALSQHGFSPSLALLANDVNVPAASQEPVRILQEGPVPLLGISLHALSLSPLANHGGSL